MTILKCLKNNKIGDTQTNSDFKLELKDNKILIKNDTQKNVANEKPEEGKEPAQTNEIQSIEMSEYLLDQNQILFSIARLIYRNQNLVSSVLKHKEGKTFKYIIRNIISLEFLKITGKKQQIVLQEENDDEMNHNVHSFMNMMLL